MPKVVRKRKKTEQDELIDALLKKGGGGPKAAEDLLVKLTAAVMNRALKAELADHLDYEEGEAPPEGQANRRNGHRKKKVRTGQGVVEIEVPRDREGTYEPQLVKPHQRSVPGFDERILALYSRGMSTRDIQRFFEEEYGVDVSPDLVTRVTNAVLDEARAWQSRPLQAVYPIVYVDALVVKVKSDGVVDNKSLYLVVGVDDEGMKDVLGMWLQATEGAKFWLSIFSELQNRGLKDILFLCADGLTGMPEAVEAAFPKTVFQTCIVHLIRSSTRLVPWAEKRAVCADLRRIYTASSIDAALAELDHFEAQWGKRYPMVVKAWRSRVTEWTPFLSYSPELRYAIYTTNIIEGLNRQLRKVLKTKGHLPSDDAVLKLVYLVLRSNRSFKQTRRGRDWSTIRLQLNLLFKDRFPIEL